ncbi:MAG: protein kinase [Gemmatimonadota bacterium]
MTDAITRLNEALRNRYRIERELGAGGMATVYLAEDLKHDRSVALKVLRPELAAVVGAERFLGEIRTTANLQHPNILPLFDSGEAAGFLYFVMPYVEGETLRDRLDREKQLPVEEAVRIATEIADALQAAHDQGIIHRDVKPANILLSRGRPLVADFGIALAVSAAGGGRLTETGLSMGTPYYMSPEQASADREPTAASDIYSLGSVLYEMLVGDPPHTGGTAQAVLAKILTADPPAASVSRPTIPANVDSAIRKALARLPADRFASAEQFGRALTDPSFRFGRGPTPAEAGGPGLWKPVALAAVVVAIVAVAGAGRTWMRPVPPAPVARFGSPFLPGQEIRRGGDFAISPDGTFLVYAGPGDEGGVFSRLWVRRFRELEAAPIAGTDGGRHLNPSISPDGLEVAFGDRSFDGVRTVRIDGGPVRMLMAASAYAFWGEDGFIYALDGAEGIFRVPAGGGEPERVSGPVPGASMQYVTDLLPGGQRALVTLVGGDIPNPVADVALLDLTTGETRRILPGWGARFIEPGYLVFVADGTLNGTRFDPGAGRLGEPLVPLMDGVDDFSLSETGTLVYRPALTSREEFVWVSREGAVTPVAQDWTVEGLVGRGFELSPDGRRLVLTTSGDEPGTEDVWVKELPDGPLQRLTFGEGPAWGPRWTASGERVTYTSGQTGGRLTLSRRFNGTGPVDTLFGGFGDSLDAPDAQLDPTGEWLVLRVGVSGGRERHIAAGRPGPDEDPPALIVGGPYNAAQPALSPDGRLLAYISDESGRNEVYVRPFPDVGADRVLVSTEGGLQPRWSRDGTELFYVGAGTEMTAARIAWEPVIRVVSREELFTIPIDHVGLDSPLATNYDVAANGQRFLVARSVSDPDDVTPGLVVVLNWVEEMRSAVGR